MRIEELEGQTGALAMKISHHCGKKLEVGLDSKTTRREKAYQETLNLEIQSIESMKSKLDKKCQQLQLKRQEEQRQA